jgi:hypothetical protein
MNLQEFCKYISAVKEFNMAIKFAFIALPVWDNYCKNNSPCYTDSITGLIHKVDSNLLINTLNESLAYFSDAEKSNRLSELYKNFDDPVIALQDMDWDLPDEVERIFYSVYNIARGLLSEVDNENDQLIFYVAINQAIDVIESEGILTERQIRDILDEFKKAKLSDFKNQ